jgi:hypothetical protein
MPGDTYSVKVNRQEGAVEINGPDKVWVAEQLARLAVVFESAPTPAQQSGGGKPAAGANGGGGGEQKPAQARRRASASSKATRVPELEQKLTKEVRAKLDTYKREREGKWTKLSTQAAVIATFLQDELEMETVSPDDMYTVYSAMGWRSPGNPRKQLDNARARDGYFLGWTSGRLALSHTGENFGRHGAKE